MSYCRGFPTFRKEDLQGGYWKGGVKGGRSVTVRESSRRRAVRNDRVEGTKETRKRDFGKDVRYSTCNTGSGVTESDTTPKFSRKRRVSTPLY